MLIAFPPCTHLANSGARWFAQKRKDGRQQQGIDFFMLFTKSPVSRVCIENPRGIISRIYRKPDQVIQPYHFGHEVQKSTCLWLKGLSPLRATKIVDRGMIYVDPRGHKHGGEFTNRAKNEYSPLMLLPANRERWKIRSRTFPGIAKAMAEQWGRILLCLLMVLLLVSAPGESAEKPRLWLTTGYCPGACCCGPNADGITASGAPAVGRLAASPRWMKLGTVIEVPGYGRAKVLDRYSRRLSDRFDLLFPTHAEAKAWGARRVKVKINR